MGSGYMTFPETGMFEFGLCSVGKSRLFVDDVLVVDNGYDKPQTIGDTFYGLGTREETGVGLTARCVPSRMSSSRKRCQTFRYTTSSQASDTSYG